MNFTAEAQRSQRSQRKTFPDFLLVNSEFILFFFSGAASTFDRSGCATSVTLWCQLNHTCLYVSHPETLDEIRKKYIKFAAPLLPQETAHHNQQEGQVR